jgi:hypothetical protein
VDSRLARLAGEKAAAGKPGAFRRKARLVSRAVLPNGLAALSVSFQNAQQPLPVVENSLACAPKLFKGLFIRVCAQPPKGIAGSHAGADNFPHKAVEHLYCVAAELFFKRFETRVLLGRSFTHNITSREVLNFTLLCELFYAKGWKKCPNFCGFLPCWLLQLLPLKFGMP